MLSVFPSPTSGMATIVRPMDNDVPADVSLWSSRGELVDRWTMTAFTGSVDLSERVEGVYVLRCRTAQGTWTARVVVARGE